MDCVTAQRQQQQDRVGGEQTTSARSQGASAFVPSSTQQPSTAAATAHLLPSAAPPAPPAPKYLTTMMPPPVSYQQPADLFSTHSGSFSTPTKARGALLYPNNPGSVSPLLPVPTILRVPQQQYATTPAAGSPAGSWQQQVHASPFDAVSMPPTVAAWAAGGSNSPHVPGVRWVDNHIKSLGPNVPPPHAAGLLLPPAVMHPYHNSSLANPSSPAGDFRGWGNTSAMAAAQQYGTGGSFQQPPSYAHHPQVSAAEGQMNAHSGRDDLLPPQQQQQHAHVQPSAARAWNYSDHLGMVPTPNYVDQVLSPHVSHGFNALPPTLQASGGSVQQSSTPYLMYAAALPWRSVPG